jgi:hypothetical protein
MNKKRFIAIIFVFIIIIVLFVTVFKKQDPAKYVEENNVSETELIKEFTSDEYGNIYLYVGNEIGGFKHLLMRHSGVYFKDYSPKGALFPKNSTGKQIIEGIEEVIDEGHKVESNKDRNYVIEDEIKLNGEEADYRLVIKVENNSVVTFFKIDPNLNKNEN